jgi:hypothetical protein
MLYAFVLHWSVARGLVTVSKDMNMAVLDMFSYRYRIFYLILGRVPQKLIDTKEIFVFIRLEDTIDFPAYRRPTQTLSRANFI